MSSVIRPDMIDSDEDYMDEEFAPDIRANELDVYEDAETGEGEDGEEEGSISSTTERISESSYEDNGGKEESGDNNKSSSDQVWKKKDKYEMDVFGRKCPKGRRNWFTSEYGANFVLMSGNIVPRQLNREVSKPANNVKYIQELYSSDISLEELRREKETERIPWGSFLKSDPDSWNIWSSQDDLDTLSTLDVQRNVATAVNSRRKMEWTIGVEKNGMVTGCELSGEDRDILRQAVDFSLSREFVPPLDTSALHLKFIRVSAISGERFVVRISLNCLLDSMHQLSSGRIFYLVGDHVLMAENMDQVRRALEERFREKKKEKIMETLEEEKKKIQFIPYAIVVTAITITSLIIYRRFM